MFPRLREPGSGIRATQDPSCSISQPLLGQEAAIRRRRRQQISAMSRPTDRVPHLHPQEKSRNNGNRRRDGRTGPGSAQYDKKMIPKVLIPESDHNKSGLHKNYHIFFLDSFSLTRIF